MLAKQRNCPALSVGLLRRRHRHVCLSRTFCRKARNGRFDADLIASHNQNVETVRRHFHHKIVVFKEAPNEPSQLSIERSGHGRIERVVAAIVQTKFCLHRIKQLPERHAARLEMDSVRVPLDQQIRTRRLYIARHEHR